MPINRSNIFPLALSTALLGLASVAFAQTDPAADRAALLQSVPSIKAPGALAGTLSLLNDHTGFGVLSGSEERGRGLIVAAAHAEKGRVVVYGHDGFVSGESLKDAGTARLLTNAVTWAAAGKPGKPIRVGLIDQAGSSDALKAAGFTVVTILPADAARASSFDKVDALLVNATALQGDSSAQAISTIQKWVRAGGGLISFGVGWGWQQLNPGKRLEDAEFNRLLVPLAAIGCNGGTADPTGSGGAFLADGVGLSDGDADAALTRLEQHAAGYLTLTPEQTGIISRTLGEATDVLPETDTIFLPRLKSLLSKHGVGPAGSVVPTRYSPVGLDQPIARIAAVLEARRLSRLPAAEVKPHPSAAAFPGTVGAEAPRLKAQLIQVDTHVPAWHSTGLYAAPGEVITVNVPLTAAGKGLGVRIGAHSDADWNLSEWWRFPEITTETPIQSYTMQIANAFGGTIYITVPESGAADGLGIVPVRIDGAVAQPYFVKNTTKVADWIATIRNYPAPWTELQGNSVILTVPSYAVRNLRDPQALMEYWDQVADAAADLYAIPRSRRRQERYCVDIQISAGYMHSGYPIMTFEDVAQTFVNLRVLRGTDGLKTWGFYHELGHNHQQPAWTWDGLGEVTNNLFSLYGNETFNAVKPDYVNSHPDIAPQARHDKLVTYLAKGVTPDGEVSDPFLALTMFIQLRQAFGWDPFKAVFLSYNAEKESELPKTELDKHDQFMLRFSKAVGKNLGPFFTMWGVTTSPEARKSIEGLVTWTPGDWPTADEVNAARAKLPPTVSINTK